MARIVKVLLVSFLAGLCAPATQASTLAAFPASPTSLETVRLQVPAGVIAYNPRKTRVAMSDNRIKVSVEAVEGAATSPMDLPLGRLPSGDYTIELSRRLPDGTEAGLVGTTTFKVVAPMGPVPLIDYTDLWWDPAESGWGLSIIQHRSGTIFATWFVYGADGTPTWYVVPEGRWSNNYGFPAYDGPIYQTTGPALSPCTEDSCPPFDPKAVEAKRVGNIVLELRDRDRISIHFGMNPTIYKTVYRLSY